MKNIFYSYTIFLFVFLPVFELKTQNASVKTDTTFEKSGIGNVIYLLEDESGKFTISDILSDSLNDQFILSESPEPNFGFTSSVYWIKFAIKNPPPRKTNFYIEIAYPLIDSVEFYAPDSEGFYSLKRTGDHLPFDSRDIKHRNFIFKLPVNSGSQHTYYFRFRTSSSMSLPIILWSETALLSKIESEQLFLGIFFGAVIIMIVYNIFLFAGFRELSFVYLLLFIASFGFAQLTINGLAFQYLRTDWILWSNSILPFFIFSALTAAVQFCRSLLNTKETIPIWDSVLRFENYLFLAGMFFSLLADYAISIRIASGSSIIAVLSVSISGLIGAVKGERSAVIFMSAWGMFLIGTVLFAFKSFGILPGNFITNWSMQIGFFVMMVLLSIAVQDRIETERKEKQKTQGQLINALKQSGRILEQKAEERTQEINRINILLMDRAIELASINQLTEKVNSSLKLSEVLDFACEELVKVFSVSYASISLLDNDNLKLSVAAFHSNDKDIIPETGKEVYLSDNEAFRTVMESKQPLAIHNAGTDPGIESMNKVLQDNNIQSLLIVPVILFKKVIGVINLNVSDPEFLFGKYETELARTIAMQVASAVENARQYSETEYALDIAEHDLEIGRQIQSGFFPDLIPQIPDWEISAHFKSARQVAGDFYDVFQLNDSNLTAIVIADVCDKGVGAALFMVLFRSLLRAYSETTIRADEIETGLENVILNTNNYIAKTHNNSNMFASIFFGIIDPDAGKIYYINAGHDAPVLLNKSGDIVKKLIPTGPVAGMFPDLNFTTESVHMNRGDLVFAFTDGTIDAVNSRKEFFAEENLLKILNSPRSSGLSLLFDLNSAIRKHIGQNNQYDDITQIVVRRKLSSEDNIHSISRPALTENLGELRDFAEQAAGNFRLSKEVSFALKLSVEEICTNIINYGYAGMPAGNIDISLEFCRDKVILKISDQGKHFSPDQAQVPDINAELEYRQTGGFGLYFIKQLMDRVIYTKGDDNNNILILEKILT